MTMTDLLPSLSIDNLLQQRDAMVERIKEAHRLLGEADELAGAMFADEYRGHRLALQVYSTRSSFTSERGLLDLIKEIDGRAWSFLLQKSGLQTFLDAEAREQWRKAIDKNDVPDLTRENINATFRTLYEARHDMFERGVVECFRSLSWDYKTNCPRMFGKRIVLRFAVEVWGGKDIFGPSHGGCDKLDDLTRVMSVLDGHPEPDHRHATWQRLTELQWMRRGGPTVASLEPYLSVRGFKNGNAHLTFMRPDLVEAMNKIIAKHHPNALAPAC